ncbi:MAG: hypothetical protein V4585_08385 [Bacteroidota bacterium]|jgi:hypothetical protein
MKQEPSSHTIIYTRPTDHLLFLLGSLGIFLYVIFFLVQTEYLLSLVFLSIAIFLIYRYLKTSISQPKLILSQDGIQVVGQPFVSWAMVHSLHIRSNVKGNEYSETLVFTNNGRIQEFEISKLYISSWQLERLLEVYQERFRNYLEEEEI